MTVGEGALLAAAAALAGAVNSVAGGGTLFTYPALRWYGLDAVLANTTSTVAIWPGTVGAIHGYREDLRGSRRVLVLLGIPALLGGAIGAFLLLNTPAAVFGRIVPWLILFATLLFMASGRIEAALSAAGEREAGGAARRSAGWWAAGASFQLLISTYGGYFGAGAGFLMLALFSILGLRDIHAMNGIKMFLAMLNNAVAIVVFAANSRVEWVPALVMAAAALAGGLAGARAAKRVGRGAARGVVVVAGLAVSAVLLWKEYR